jgi:hypothetical protein
MAPGLVEPDIVIAVKVTKKVSFTAWAAAAANEVSSRGKQAYQRTCPFYKIIPGFSIT